MELASNLQSARELELSDDELEVVSGGCDCGPDTMPVIISKPGGGYKVICVPQS